MRTAAALLAAAALAGCTLVEVAVPEVEQVVVVEGVLRPDLSMQRVALHASVGGEGGRGVTGARVTVRTPTGRVVTFQPVPAAQCVASPPLTPFACYQSSMREGPWVTPGGTYDLEIVLADGGRAAARTQVPGAFSLVRPAPGEGRTTVCRLPPGTSLPLAWTRAAGTWSYLAEMEIAGLRQAFGGLVPGEIPDEIRLTALSISEADTTMTLPGDFGIFQRGDFDQPLLLALRDGLPPGIVARVTLAAVDRNYVNAVRGGSFNPSGRVRIPSVTGAATGLFGSVVTKEILVDTRASGTNAPPCLSP